MWKQTNRARFVGVAVLANSIAALAFGADLPQFQPCWRGQAGATFQAWGFSDTPTNAGDFGFFGPEVTLPDAGWVNPNGTPEALIVAEQGGLGWIDNGNDIGISTTFSGIWDLGYGGGSVALTIPTASGSASLTRDVWVQISEATAIDVTMTNTVSVVGGTLIGTIQRITNETNPNFTWFVSQSMWRVPADSSSVTITISGGCPSCNPGGGGQNSFVNSVVVDTRLADSSLISPGGSLNVATQTECTGLTIDPSSTYTWEMNNATASAGSGFDTVAVTGNSNINVQATTGSKCTINLISLNGSVQGQAANFNNNASSSWTIASASGGSVLNFDANKFALSYTTAQFQNNLGGGVFSLALSGDGKSINLVFTPNQSPVANNAAFTRGPGLTLKFKIADLLANSTSDPDGHARALHALDSTSSQGATITSDGTYIYYQPVNDNADSFNYTVRDLASTYRVGDPVRTASAQISVSVLNQGGVIREISSSGGPVTLTCAGIPGFQYDVQRSATADFTSPVVVLTTNVPANGLFSFTDNNPPAPSAFYRLMQHQGP